MNILEFLYSNLFRLYTGMSTLRVSIRIPKTLDIIYLFSISEYI